MNSGFTERETKILGSNLSLLMEVYDNATEIAKVLYELARTSKPDVAAPAYAVLEKHGYVEEGIWVD